MNRKKQTVVLQEKSGKSKSRQIAEAILEPGVSNAIPLHAFATKGWGDESTDLSDMMAALNDAIVRSRDGDANAGKSMLLAQAATLNQIFTELARRSAASLGGNIEVVERYLKLSLRAQSQCRATLETLAAITNPPIVIARQANVTTGPQQINNVPPSLHTENIQNAQDKLLESDHEQWLDTRAPSSAVGTYSEVEPLGKVDRPTNS